MEPKIDNIINEINFIDDRCIEIHKEYNVIKYVSGLFVDYKIKYNPIWIVQKDDIIYVLIYCESNIIIKFGYDDYKKIKKFETINKENITWYKDEKDELIKAECNDKINKDKLGSFLKLFRFNKLY
jgi:hypothetical protein